MSTELENNIKDVLKDVKPWQRVPTSVEGVFLVKTPANDNRETIMVEINPLNERGTSMKRKGLFLKSTSEFEGFGNVFKNDKVLDLLDAIESIAGRARKKEIKAIEL